MAGETVDGNDVLVVVDAVSRAAERARRGDGPTLLEFETFRMRGHEEASGTAYVPKHLFEEWATKDPIARFESRLLADGTISADERDDIRAAFKAHIDRLADEAFESPEPDSTAERELADVYAPSPRSAAPREAQPSGPPARSARPSASAASRPSSEKRYIDAISDALREAMRRDPSVLLLGQDIAEYGGAFKVTAGFVEEFGRARVRNTPIIESGVLGAALGLALEGFRPMVEMQFGDFITCGFNQIVNNLAKTHYRWGAGVPVVIRVPVGGGTGAGPYHSQNPEAWFTHVAGLKVVAPATPSDAKGLLLAAFEDGNPVLYLEHKFLYRSAKSPVADGYFTVPIGPATIAREGRDVTIVTWGVGVAWAQETASTHGARRRLGRDRRPAHVAALGPRSRARLGQEDQPGHRPARGADDRRVRRGNRRRDRRGGVRVAGRAGDAHERIGHASAVQQGARGDLLAQGTTGRRDSQGARVLTSGPEGPPGELYVFIDGETVYHARMSTTSSRLRQAMSAGDLWSITDANELYEVLRWGKGYFSINGAGHIQVHPTKDPSRAIDLKQLVDDLQARGITLPLLIRFSDILKHRLGDIHEAFQAAIAQHQYNGRYCCVYPIKVNQQRQVVEEVLNFGAPFQFGLEAGSKPELLAVVAMASNDTPIMCNGFKDAEYIETVMLAQKMGRNIIPVVEKYTELGLILEYSEKIGVRPQIGMRVKLAARGGGRWQSSGGYRSKFGLTVGEILEGLDELKRRGMADCFKLLHFHLGSQIPNIRVVKHALNEAARIYAELHKAGAGLQYLDVGGGLGVDYDGSQTNFESSTNYTLEEYANDVVYHIQSACDDAGVPHPTIVSESGRAVVAYHSVLVFNVLGVSGFGNGGHRPAERRRGRAAADRPDGHLQQPDDAERARELSRRATGAGHGPEPVQRRLPAARPAEPGRVAVLGNLLEAAADRPAARRSARGSAEP